METFNDVASPVLRAYNRCMIASNLYDDRGPVLAQNYIEQFNKEDKKVIDDVLNVIKKHGTDYMVAFIRRNTEFELS